jgi:ketosteroid isomerase-like protein
MRFILTFIVMAPLAIFSGCSSGPQEATSANTADAPRTAPSPESVFKTAEQFAPGDVAAIHEMRDRWVSAFAAGNAAPVEFMFSGDAVFSLPAHPSLQELGPEPPARKVFDRFTAKLDLDPKSRFVTDGGDPRKTDMLPWVSYYAGYTLTLTPKSGGEAVQSRGQFMTRFHRQPDGSLKVIRGPGLGEPGPDFVLNLMKGGGRLQLASLRGKPTVLIFGSYT